MGWLEANSEWPLTDSSNKTDSIHPALPLNWTTELTQILSVYRSDMDVAKSTSGIVQNGEHPATVTLSCELEKVWISEDWAAMMIVTDKPLSITFATVAS